MKTGDFLLLIEAKSEISGAVAVRRQGQVHGEGLACARGAYRGLPVTQGMDQIAKFGFVTQILQNPQMIRFRLTAARKPSPS